MIRLFKITGSSMEPSYRSGDFVLVSRLSFLWAGIRAGDVIVFHQKAYGTLVKEVETIDDSGMIHTVGTDPNSVDSKSFGPIRAVDVIGKVIFRVPAQGTPR